MIEQKHLDLLLELRTDRNPHSGRDLLDHLRGVHDCLEAWGNEQAVCLGGLFHSIYGTQTYRTASASLGDRSRIREAIGERAERLAYLFSSSHRRGFFEQLSADAPALLSRICEDKLPVTRDELRDLIEMEVANYVEFMPRLEFTHQELDAFEAKVEAARGLVSDPARAAIGEAIVKKRASLPRT